MVTVTNFDTNNVIFLINIIFYLRITLPSGKGISQIVSWAVTGGFAIDNLRVTSMTCSTAIAVKVSSGLFNSDFGTITDVLCCFLDFSGEIIDCNLTFGSHACIKITNNNAVVRVISNVNRTVSG
ncbi:hypothetical protein SDC9_181218 [bioreactor metagenome]|uniref:Uncharacterized protein n=1 Tax=bioreactor metagenome TaxID=1076179 RepID=A0A645H3Y3_9ZZZZ